MGFLRPATPGFLVTCVATALLAVVSFCVPYFKSVYFLKANISIGGKNGSITLGTLGYCLELSNGTTCSSPSVGYELDINTLVGNTLPVQIPEVVVKWLTYCLVLHIVALGLSAGSAVFGLLAHIREMSMTYCSTCISGLAAVVTLLAFIFDIAIFFAARARINAVGSAEIGNATWLTLAAWVLLFLSGCFYTVGRCCISNRAPRSAKSDNWDKVESRGPDATHNRSEQIRLDAVRAEADRKARQNNPEVGLPAFHEAQPLTAYTDGENVYTDDPRQQTNAADFGGRPAQGGGYSGGGYVKAPVGTRAVDEYHSPTQTEYPATYPPAPQHNNNYGPAGYAQQNASPASRRQGSGYAQSQYSKSNYAPSNYNAPQTNSPPMPQYLSATTPHTVNPYGKSGRDYGHSAAGSSYHTASASHDQQAMNYSHYDPYEPQQTYNSYNPPAPAPPPTTGNAPSPSNYYLGQSSTPTRSPSQNDRSYTLGGGGYVDNGYGGNSVPPLPEHNSYFPEQPISAAPMPINTNTGYVAPAPASPLKGPRSQPHMSVRNDDELPPMYDAGSSHVQGAWGKS